MYKFNNLMEICYKIVEGRSGIMMRRLLVLEIAAHYLPLLMMVDTRAVITS